MFSHKRTATFTESNAKKQKTEFRFPLEVKNIITHIADFLDATDLAIFASTCKGIHENLTPRVYQVNGPEKEIAKASDRVEIDAKDIDEEIIKKRFSKVKFLKIKMDKLCHDSIRKLFPLSKTCKLFPKLEEVVICSTHYIKFTNDAPSIRKLTVFSSAESFLSESIHLIQACSIEELSLFVGAKDKIYIFHANLIENPQVMIKKFQGTGELSRRFGITSRNRKARISYESLVKGQTYSF